MLLLAVDSKGFANFFLVLGPIPWEPDWKWRILLKPSSDLKPSISSLKNMGSWNAPAIMIWETWASSAWWTPFWHSVDLCFDGMRCTLCDPYRGGSCAIRECDDTWGGVECTNLGQLHTIKTLVFLGSNLLWPEIQLEVYLIKQELVLWVHAQNVV